MVIGYSRTHHYYHHKQPQKDWHTKQLIEAVLREHPGYGHKRLATHLKINKKRVLRVMKLFGIKPYRRTTPKVFKSLKVVCFPTI
ncbi:MAG: transposase [Candidatus Nomurabacteria bacterium]|nr:MAG: transposase [Candidatus Nomurabacteria bacterium]